MRVRLICEGVEAPVSPFVGRFTANICLAIAASLKAPAPVKHMQYELQGETVSLQIDGLSVPLGLNQGFAETIVRDTLRGMVRHLKGVDPERGIRIHMELEDQP